ncbi:MAG: hypothetical protein O8C66_07270 [Candidatus Methanoperedens sp.]|nr:hypothetical protein [Candidatus Methanoperedens sp.]MCZ7370294.1 hypothetical protein [Candidatus Methanoperedens sp.]
MLAGDRIKVVSTLKRTMSAGLVLLFAIILLSNAGSATVYTWKNSNGVWIAPGITTNWGSCSKHPGAYTKTLLTDQGKSNCSNTFHDSYSLDPAVDMFFNNSYKENTFVQGNWYSGRLSVNRNGDGTFTFKLIYVLTDGTIIPLSGSSVITVPEDTGNDYNISLKSIHGTVPGGAKLGLRISKNGSLSKTRMKIYFGDKGGLKGTQSGNISVTETPSGDTIPPASITNLANMINTLTFINWTWTDPSDPDFAKVMVYLDGVYQNDVLKGAQYYSAIVAPGTYTIGTRTVDTNGNQNATLVTHTATTILPTIRFINGTVMDSSNKTGIAGVTVSTSTCLSTTTNASGFYSFAVSAGTYGLTARLDPTYYTNNTITVSTLLSAVVVQDNELVKKPTGTITGSVTNV